MSDDEKDKKEEVLSHEEVDAILKVTQENNEDLSKIVSEDNAAQEDKHYQYALSNINESVRVECERNLSSFLRKRILVKTKSFNLSKMSTCLNENAEHSVYTIFRLSPNDHYGMAIIDLGMLHQTINLLFGGRINSKEEVMKTPGKIGVIVTEKLTQLCLDSFALACKEYGEVTHETLKTTSVVALAADMGLEPEEKVYMLDFSILFEELEMTLKLIIKEEFLINFIPEKSEGAKHREKDFWQTAIKTQVVDSYVTVTISLPEENINVKDFMALKEGDILPISDPTQVFVCLNNLKLFTAIAGQSNSKRVAKIVSQI